MKHGGSIAGLMSYVACDRDAVTLHKMLLNSRTCAGQRLCPLAVTYFSNSRARIPSNKKMAPNPDASQNKVTSKSLDRVRRACDRCKTKKSKYYIPIRERQWCLTSNRGATVCNLARNARQRRSPVSTGTHESRFELSVWL